MTMKTLILAGLVVLSSPAQTLTEPFVMIRFLRHGAQNAAASDLVRPYVDGGARVPVFAATSITGVPETWLLEAHDSFAGLEAVDRALLAGAGAAPPRWRETFIGVYRPGLSYRPEEAAKLLARARYLQITIYRFRPGMDGRVAEFIRLQRAGSDFMNLDRPDMAYRLVSGSPAPAYIVVAPLVSLKAIDDALARRDALSDGPPAKAERDLIAEAEVSRESILFRIDPRSSYLPDEFTAADPEFWRGKSE